MVALIFELLDNWPMADDVILQHQVTDSIPRLGIDHHQLLFLIPLPPKSQFNEFCKTDRRTIAMMIHIKIVFIFCFILFLCKLNLIIICCPRTRGREVQRLKWTAEVFEILHKLTFQMSKLTDTFNGLAIVSH